jgi:hypothetical protein
MARRAALTAVLPSICSSLHTVRDIPTFVARGVSLLDGIGESMESDLMPVPADETDCQVAKEGTDCYRAVTFLRREGFTKHPNWYPGYTSETPFEEVQDMLHGLEKSNCPKPCLPKVPLTLARAEVIEPTFDCRDTVEGDLCYSSIAWLKDVGFELHPSWYPNFEKSSTVPTIQAELHRHGKADCPRPCALTNEEGAAAQEVANLAPQNIVEATAQPEENARHADDCMDAQPGQQCYNAVAYGIAEGIKKHPALYEGLTEASNFKQVQEEFYLKNKFSCKRPCPQQKVGLDELADHPEKFREKKRVEDMSTAELTAYLSGDWDGYVAKLFRSQEFQVTSTLEERKYDSATTTIMPDEAMPLPLVDAESWLVGEKAANATEPEKAATETALDDVEAANNTVPDAASNVTEEMADARPPVTPGGQEASNVSPQRHDDAEREAGPFPTEEVVPETGAALEVLECLRKLSDVTPGTFDDLKAECERVMVDKLPDAGAQRSALAKEGMRFFIWAQRRVDELRAKQRAIEAQEAVSGAQNVSHDDGVVDEPMPEVDAEGQDETAGPKPTDAEPQPIVSETAEQMEQRLWRQLTEELKVQTTTVSPHRETEAEMRERIRAEVMRELTMSKGS